MRQEQEIFDELAKLCSSQGYPHAIAFLCFRDNMVGYSGEMTAEDMRHLFSESRLIRTEISTLIGLCIKEKIDYTLPSPQVIQEYLDRTEALLEELHRSMSESMFANMFAKQSPDANSQDPSAGEIMREPIFYGGESAYSFQYRDLTPRKYARDGEWLAANKGFSAGEATQVVRVVGKVQDERLMQTAQSMRALHPNEWTFLPGFEFTVQEIAKCSGLDERVVRNVLDAFALTHGERNAGFDALHDFNISNALPLIPRGSDKYLLFQPYSLVEALYEGPFYWMGADETYESAAMRHRGQYTEEFSRERLEQVFGTDNVHANVDIQKSKHEKVSEIDTLVIFGSRAIVVQAKSKRLTLEARKGNDGRLKDDFKKSIQTSYNQGLECAQMLVEAKHTFVDSDSKVIKIPPDLKEIYIFCVVADHYPALSFQARQFLRYETTEKIPPPFVMDLFMLDTMTEMLESPLRLLSYVNRRVNYADNLLASHELTILSYHLKQNLWLDGEADMVSLHDDISADLDVAMAVRRDGVPGKRTPDGILTRFKSTSLGRIIEEIEARPEPATIDLGFMLLNLSEEAVKDISNGIDKITSQARSDGKNHDLTVAIGTASTGLTVHCNRDSIRVASPRLQAHCERRKYRQKANSWYGVCLHPDNSLPRFGLSLDFDWAHSEEMDEATAHLTKRNDLADLKSIGERKRKIGRNQPCPCGSGKKYKKCCLLR